MKYYTFDCGCKFKLLDDNEDKEIPSIDFSLSLEDLNLDCKKTWDLISSGNTKGCFQLESRLGRSMAKKLRPENIEQLSALISIMRPGCLEAMRDNKIPILNFCCLESFFGRRFSLLDESLF